MKRKPIEIALPRGGFGILEVGRILKTITSLHTLDDGRVLECKRHMVKMQNKRGPFGASVRFTFGGFSGAAIGKAA